jgi:hypothetical protein
MQEAMFYLDDLFRSCPDDQSQQASTIVDKQSASTEHVNLLAPNPETQWAPGSKESDRDEASIVARPMWHLVRNCSSQVEDVESLC